MVKYFIEHRIVIYKIKFLYIYYDNNKAMIKMF